MNATTDVYNPYSKTIESLANSVEQDPIEVIRERAIHQLIEDEKRRAATDALIEGAKLIEEGVDALSLTRRFILERFEEHLRCRFDLGGEWPGYMLSPSSIY